jgi:hypothetical protein
MGFAQAGVVVGEGKAVTSDQPRWGEKKGCDAPGSIEPVAGENGCWGAERRSVQRSRLRRSVPGMPVVGKAANRITWNHFFALAALRLGPGSVSKLGRGCAARTLP